MGIICDRTKQTIKLNFEDVQCMDKEIANGYKKWVEDAPAEWKQDGFLENHSPIVVTSRFGQNAAIAIPGNEEAEGRSWNEDRDFSKTAYLTFALATSIE